MTIIIIKLIRFYQYFSKDLIQQNALPLLVVPQCRFYPTCSDYAIEAINQHGLLRGSAKGLIRILKCNPLTTSR